MVANQAGRPAVAPVEWLLTDRTVRGRADHRLADFSPEDSSRVDRNQADREAPEAQADSVWPVR